MTITPLIPNSKRRILIIETSSRDAALMEKELQQTGQLFDIMITSTLDDFRREIETFRPDIILSGYTMSKFTARDVLLIKNELKPDLPFIIVANPLNEEDAVECIKLEADDYVMKGHLARLVPTVENILKKRLLEKVSSDWRLVFDAMHDAVALLDADLKILRCNKIYRKLVGKPFEKILGQICCSVIHGAARTPLDCPVQNIRRTLKRETWQMLLGESWFDIIADPLLDVNGRLAGIVHTLKDVTERKHAEEALRNERDRAEKYLDLAEVIFVALNTNGEVTLINRKGREILGYEQNEIIGKNWFDNFLPVSIKEETRTVFEEIIAGKTKIIKNYENLILTKNKTEKNIAWHNSIINDDEGNIIGTLSSGEDITEQVMAKKEKGNLEQQLAQAQKMEAVGRLAGGVAHDFNNMLSVILGYGEALLKDFKKDDPVWEDINEIVVAGQRAAGIVRQLMAFSRKQTLQPEVLEINDIVKNLEKMLKRLIGEDIDLVSLLAEDLWKVMADPSHIEQIIMNLSVNARDAMPQGGKLTIETANIELDEKYAIDHLGITPGPHVMLAITDTGCGMDEEIKNMIFEPFFTTKEMGKGTGLGLSTVYGIVKQSGGSISVYSKQDHGTRFKIYLPSVDAEVTKIEAVKASVTKRGHGELLLVVEDDTPLRGLIHKILTSSGYRSKFAPNGKEAIRVVEEQELRPDLLITDIVMPGISGTLLAERLRRIQPDLKVIYMSGYTDDTMTHHGVIDSKTPFLQKPFSAKKLVDKIREVLDSRYFLENN